MTWEKAYKDFVDFAEKDHLPVEGIAIADEKQLLAHKHFVPDLPRNIYSHTKSYMVTAVGLAIAMGKLSLEDRLAAFFPEKVPDNAPEALHSIKLRHLLTMSSGFGKAYLMSVDRRAGTGAPDYMTYMLSRPVLAEPGAAFCYSTADSILALRMVEKAVDTRLGEFLYKELFSKMDMGYPLWEHDPQGHPNGGGGMFLKLTEMMKLGQLYLANGVWQGERILDPAWVRQATTKQIDTKPDDIWSCGYGYQFWMCPYPKAYRADGAYGQITAVLPESGLVVSVQCPEVGDFARVKKALHELVLTQI